MFKLIYLYIDEDNFAYQSDTPPTPLELSCVASGILKVFRWYANAYEEIEVTDNKINVTWNKVESADSIEDLEIVI